MVKWLALALVTIAMVGISGSSEPMTLLFLALFVGPMIAAAYSARRLPPAMTGVKMAVAGGLLTAFLVGYVTSNGVVQDTRPVADLDFLSLLISTFAIVGTPICAGFVIGAGFGLSRRQNGGSGSTTTPD